METSASIDSSHNQSDDRHGVQHGSEDDRSGKPPSTTAGSTGETVLNETAFDVSEIRETVNSVGPEAGQAHARISGMSCDELVSLLESNGPRRPRRQA